MDWITPVAIIVSLLLIGFLPASRSPLFPANQYPFEANRKQGTYTAAKCNILPTPPGSSGTTLVGINIVFVVYGLLVVDALPHLALD